MDIIDILDSKVKDTNKEKNELKERIKSLEYEILTYKKNMQNSTGLLEQFMQKYRFVFKTMIFMQKHCFICTKQYLHAKILCVSNVNLIEDPLEIQPKLVRE